MKKKQCVPPIIWVLLSSLPLVVTVAHITRSCHLLLKINGNSDGPISESSAVWRVQCLWPMGKPEHLRNAQHHWVYTGNPGNCQGRKVGSWGLAHAGPKEYTSEMPQDPSTSPCPRTRPIHTGSGQQSLANWLQPPHSHLTQRLACGCGL